MPIKYGFGGLLTPVVAKATAYSVLATDCGTLFTNEGAAGSVTFTLPAPSAEQNGVGFEFANVTAQPIVIAVTGNDKLIVHNDAAADTVTTASTIGQHFKVVCVGATGWLVISDPSAASTATAVTAVTIAT